MGCPDCRIIRNDIAGVVSRVPGWRVQLASVSGPGFISDGFTMIVNNNGCSIGAESFAAAARLSGLRFNVIKQSRETTNPDNCRIQFYIISGKQ